MTIKREGWGGLQVSVQEHPVTKRKVIFIQIGEKNKTPNLGFALGSDDVGWLIDELQKARGEIEG